MFSFVKYNRIVWLKGKHEALIGQPRTTVNSKHFTRANFLFPSEAHFSPLDVGLMISVGGEN
jgi:hypothetical protein